MRVGLDVHTLHGRPQGIRTYVAHVTRELAKLAGSADELVLLGCDIETARLYAAGERWSARTWLIDWPWLRISIEAPIRELTLGLDVFHSQYICPPLSLKREVVTIHDILFETNPEWFAPGFVRRSRLLYRLSARRADLVVTDSEATKCALADVYGISESRVRVIPLGADHIVASGSCPEAPAVARSPWPERLPSRFHLFVGRIDPRKNLVRLAAAYRILHATLPDVPPLVLAGPRDYQAAAILAALADQIQSGSIVELGPVDDDTVRRLYATAEVVVYPTLGEGFGLPVLEAMAAGAAVVTSGCPAIREFADDCVLYTDPLSVEAMADTIRQAILGGQRIGELRAAAAARASKYRWSDTAAALWRAYREVTGL